MERSSKSSLQEKNLASCVPFHVIFTQSIDASTTSVSSWKEVEIRRIQDPSLKDSKIGEKLHSCSTTNKKRAVRFGSIELQFSRVPSDTTIKGTGVVRPIPIGTSTSKATQIQNLCVAIAQLPSQHDACVGFLLDSSQQRHGVYSRTTDKTQQHLTTYTLDQNLDQSQAHLAPLSMRDKLRVAVNLTSGVLQLHKTPWLKEDWKQCDIMFIDRPGASKSSVYDHPFVHRELSQRSIQQVAATPAIVYRVIRNKTLYALGIVLIELCYGKSIKGLQEPEDVHCDGTPGVEWCTADRLIRTKDLENHIGKRYADAVRRCVYCDSGVDNADLEDESFQRVVYEGVLEKLEESLQHIEG